MRGGVRTPRDERLPTRADRLDELDPVATGAQQRTPSASASPNRRVLISAISCLPGHGSEPGVGWQVVRAMASSYDVHVLTHVINRHAIEAELAREPVANLRLTYVALPRMLAWRDRFGRWPFLLYHYMWQVRALFVARQLHREHQFELVHHITFGKCWTPSFLALLPIPFVWGPVGGAESAPKAFWMDFGIRGLLFEATRESARWLAARGIFMRLTARRSSLALAKTSDTAEWLRRRGSMNIEVCSEAALTAAELARLSALRLPGDVAGFRCISVGNLLHLKGFHLALRALAASGLTDAEYWIVGDGPERRSLEALARRLAIADRVRFWGRLSRDEALERLGACHVLVHPTLHDSGGWVCLEAMAAGRPVICLDTGGPATQVPDSAGIRVHPGTPKQAIAEIAAAMSALAGDPARRNRMGRAGRELVQREYTWERKRVLLDAFYTAVMPRRPE